jgi:DNA-binding response OmpR family regulator
MIVLVVEDEKPLADLLKQALEGDGYAVLGPVDTAEEALKLSEETPPVIAHPAWRADRSVVGTG